MKHVKRAEPIVILAALAVLAVLAALAGVAGPRVASADGAASEALLHKVFVGGSGFSIINPAPGEEASGSIAFDADNAATVTINPYITSSSICAWPAQPEASVAFDRKDSVPGITFDELLHFANGCASPVDFDVQTGSNDVTITVTAPDGVTISTYLITIIVPPRPAPPGVASWAEDPVTREHTFMTPETNGRVATGFTSATGNADEFWIASQKWWDWLNGHRSTVSLYDRATGEVDNGAGFNLGPTNGRPSTFKIGPGGSWVYPELWYGNGILWMTVEIRSNQFVMPFQRTESGWTLLSDKRIRLTHYDHIRERWQYSPGDIWSDGETMWVSGYYSRVYAYNMATGERDTSKEFGVPDVGKRPFLRIHTGTPGGLWSDGTTMWVEDIYHRKVYAFDLQTKARLPGLDFDIVRAPQAGWSNRLWQSGMWSDGNIIWLKQGRYSVAYNLPGTPLPPTQSPPQFTSLYAVKLPGDAGDVPELITVTATDADDDPIAYAKAGDWPAQFGIGSGSGIISYTRGDGPPIAQGEYELTVTADDGHGGTAETTVLVIVSAPSGICDRTEQVRDAIIAKLNEGLDTPEVTDCAAVTAEYLSGITGELELSKEEIPALKSGDFEGLSNVDILDLTDNALETLPDGVFEGLVSLEQVLLSGNPGVPFALTAELEQRGDGAFVVKVVEGSPFDLTVTLSALGGTLSSTTVTVEAGSLASEPVSVKAAGNVPAQVTVTVDSATFPEDREHSGIDTGLGQPLVLDMPGNPPAETVRLTMPASVPQNTEAAVAMSFGGLESDSDTSDADYIFRADVKDAENGDADACEGGGMGNDRYMYKVDEDPEVRAATISAACPPGDYAIAVSISSPADVELASATAGFTVAALAEQQQQPEPPSTDATLSGLRLSDVTLAFASATTRYSVSVANDVTQTTVTPTVNDGGATYAIKLGGVTDADGVIPLAVGRNVITVEVTAEDGKTTKTYTITVTRATPTVSGPAVTVELSPSGPVAEGTEITVTMSFVNLESDTDTSDTDYIFRADVVDADACEGGGMGNDRYMYKVDEDPEVRTGSISTSCAPGDYAVEVSISSPGNAELASATADFTVSTPAQQQPPPEPPASTDATLSSLTLSDAPFTFASDITSYDVNVANGVDRTTVTATANDGGASYAVKLGGVTDADRVIPLAVGGNVITIEVTAEDGNTARTYTVTATRATPPPSTDATLSRLGLSGVPFTFASDTTSYDVDVANGVDQTTVTATANDGGASYVVKLGGVADGDGTVQLAVGSNVITIEVTAEDGETARTYTVTVTRADPPPPNSPEPVEPEPESTGERSAWLEQNPENKPFVGEWQEFTLRGSGLDKVDLSVNVIGFGGAPSSTGAVGYATASPPPAAGEVCGSAYYSGYQMSVDRTFSLVGCREGTVVIELLDPGNDYALLKRYSVTVNAGP